MNPNRRVKTFTNVEEAIIFKNELRERYARKGITHRRIRLKSRVNGTFDVISYDYVEPTPPKQKKYEPVDRNNKWGIIEDLVHDLTKTFLGGK